MKNPTAKSKPRPILRGAIFGGLLFGVASLAVVVGTQFRYWLLGDLNDCVYILVAIPTYFISNILHGWNGDGSLGDRIWEWLFPPPINDWIAYLLFSIVNGLLGAVLFAVPVAIWRFFMKGSHENKNQTAGIE